MQTYIFTFYKKLQKQLLNEEDMKNIEKKEFQSEIP